MSTVPSLRSATSTLARSEIWQSRYSRWSRRSLAVWPGPSASRIWRFRSATPCSRLLRVVTEASICSSISTASWSRPAAVVLRSPARSLPLLSTSSRRAVVTGGEASSLQAEKKASRVVPRWFSAGVPMRASTSCRATSAWS